MTQMQEPSALGRIVELVRDLRARCPWDAAQTPQTLRPYFVEEAAELDHALGVDDPAAIRTELGDVLLHVAFQIVLAEEAGRFGAEDLVTAVETKMWRRHPHLFDESGRRTGGKAGSENPPAIPPSRLTAQDVKDSWERTKLKESAKRSVLDGLPPTLPALVAAFRLQEKAAGVGFDWPDAEGPAAKVREELEEVHGATVHGARESEIGDLLFAVVNLARKLNVDPRAALEGANRKFTERFREVEKMAVERRLELGSVGIEVLDKLWDEAKRRA